MNIGSHLIAGSGVEFRQFLLDQKTPGTIGTPNGSGQLYFDTTAGTLAPWYYDGTSWMKWLRKDKAEAITQSWDFQIATGTSPITVTSTTKVTNFNADYLDDYHADSSANANTIAQRYTNGRLKVADPSDTQDAVNLGYMTAAIAGATDPKAAVLYTTAAALASYNYLSNVLTAVDNGALSVDGQTPAVNDRIGVVYETGAYQQYNGIYVVTVVGDGETQWVMTRSSDADQDSEVTNGLQFWCTAGDTNNGSGWLLTTPDTIILNTTPLTFIQNNGTAQITAGNGIDKTGNELCVLVSGSCTYTPYGVLYHGSSSTLSATAAGTSNTVLHGNTGGAPTWSAVDLTADVSGILPVANGGTGFNTLAGAGIVTTAGMTTSPNTIPKATGSTVLSDSTIADDGTTVTANGLLSVSTTKVGIGIAAASAGSILHVNNDSGTATFERLIQGRSSVNNSFGIGVGGNDTYISAASGGAILLATGSDLGVTGTSVPTNVRFTVSASASTLTGNGASTIATSSGNLIFQPVGVSSFGTDAQLNGNSVLWNEAGVRSWTMGTAASTGTLTLQSGDSAGVFRVYTASLYANGVLQVAGTGDSYILGNVGIGTTSPGRLLEVGVTGAAGVVGIARFSHSVGGNQRSWDIGVGEAASFGANDNFGIKDSSGGNTVLVIDTSGKVGIDTTSPGAKLDVKSSGISTWAIRALASDSGSLGGIYEGADTSADFYLYKADGSTIGVRLNSVGDCYVNTGGNVGIGTTSPGAKLDVGGITGWGGANTGLTASFSGVNSPLNGGGNLRVVGTTTHAIDTGASITIGGMYNGTSNQIDFAEISGRKENDTINNVNGYLALATRDNAQGQREWVRITSAGKVGIGTASPVQKLSLGGTDDSIGWSDTAEVAGWNHAAGNVGLIFKTTSGGAGAQTTKMTILGSGNVGIGTTAPTAYGNTTTLAINNAVWGGRLDLMFAGVVKSSLSLNTSLNTILESAQSTTHGYDLQLISGQAAAGTDLDGGDVFVSGGASTGTGASAIYLQTATPGATGTGSNAATTKVIITGAGNVGIGTASPGAKLDVAQAFSGTTIDADHIIRILNNYGTDTAGVLAGMTFRVENGVSNSRGFIGLSNNGSSGRADMVFAGVNSSGSATEYMRIKTGGNVGIGTASPNYQLALSKASGSQSEIMLESGATGLSLGYQDVGSGRGAISNINNSGTTNNLLSLGFGAITAGVPANPVMTLNQSGYVGIGTTTMTGLLNVEAADSTWLVLSYSDTRAAAKNAALRFIDGSEQFMGQLTYTSDGAANNASTLSLTIGNGSGGSQTVLTALSSGALTLGGSAYTTAGGILQVTGGVVSAPASIPTGTTIGSVAIARFKTVACVGDNTNEEIDVTHSLSTLSPVVTVWEADGSNNATAVAIVDVTPLSPLAVRLTFSSVQTTSDHYVVAFSG
jgi:hypothetical protein